MIPSLQLLFQNLDQGMTDEEHYRAELRLAELAEPLGFSEIWCVEHHFDAEYSMCPDNLQLLSYLAGRTENITLVTAAVILPWWSQPVRVAEKAAMLDILAGGRVKLGLGSRVVADGVRTVRARHERVPRSGSTRQPTSSCAPSTPERPAATARSSTSPRRRWRRPRPARFRDRLVCIAMSPDSLDVAAELGAAMATFVQFPIEQHAPLIEGYRDKFRAAHGHDAPPPTSTEFVYCSEDPDEAERTAKEYISRYFTTVMRHYEFGGTHFGETKGYQAYDAVATMIREAGQEAVGTGLLRGADLGHARSRSSRRSGPSGASSATTS